MQRYVSALGFQVEGSVSAHNALEAFRSSPSSYSLLIMDVHMPDMAGDELLRRVLEINPSVPVLVCSGYPVNLSTLAPGSHVSFLQKPFLPKMLEEEITHLLQSRT
jgi:CheY-like chemotaxis protein